MAKRTSAQNKAIYAKRNAAAQAKGFKSYAEQRKYRKEAEPLVGKGKDKRSVEARDAVGVEMKDYDQGSKTRDELEAAYSDIADEYDFEIDFNERAWYAFLDEISPKHGK